MRPPIQKLDGLLKFPFAARISPCILKRPLRICGPSPRGNVFIRRVASSGVTVPRKNGYSLNNNLRRRPDRDGLCVKARASFDFPRPFQERQGDSLLRPEPSSPVPRSFGDRVSKYARASSIFPRSASRFASSRPRGKLLHEGPPSLVPGTGAPTVVISSHRRYDAAKSQGHGVVDRVSRIGAEVRYPRFGPGSEGTDQDRRPEHGGSKTLLGIACPKDFRVFVLPLLDRHDASNCSASGSFGNLRVQSRRIGSAVLKSLISSA